MLLLTTFFRALVAEINATFSAAFPQNRRNYFFSVGGWGKWWCGVGAVEGNFLELRGGWGNIVVFPRRSLDQIRLQTKLYSHQWGDVINQWGLNPQLHPPANRTLVRFYSLITFMYVKHMKNCEVPNQIIPSNSLNELGRDLCIEIRDDF